MTDEAAIELTKQRMRELGKTPDDYHFEIVPIVGTAKERLLKKISIKAYNQIYILIGGSEYSGLRIIGETGHYNTTDFTNNTAPEFTGLIEITELPHLTWSVSEVAPVVFIKITIF